MKWIGNRISFEEDKQKSTFVIYPENKPTIKGLMGAWFGMWLTIGISVVGYMLSNDLKEQEKVYFFVFMAFWTYFAFKVGRSFFWILWGKELIKVNETALTYKRSIKKYGKATPYYLDNIKKMKMSQPKEKSIQAVWEASPWVTGGERIEFEYKGKLVRFGRKLEEKDAKVLFQLITKKMEEKLRKLNK